MKTRDKQPTEETTMSEKEKRTAEVKRLQMRLVTMRGYSMPKAWIAAIEMVYGW
jgi:hypothetical protein